MSPRSTGNFTFQFSPWNFGKLPNHPSSSSLLFSLLLRAPPLAVVLDAAAVPRPHPTAPLQSTDSMRRSTLLCRQRNRLRWPLCTHHAAVPRHLIGPPQEKLAPPLKLAHDLKGSIPSPESLSSPTFGYKSPSQPAYPTHHRRPAHHCCVELELTAEFTPSTSLCPNQTPDRVFQFPLNIPSPANPSPPRRCAAAMDQTIASRPSPRRA